MADDGAISELEAPVPVEGEGGAGVLQEVAQVENSPAEEGASGTEGGEEPISLSSILH
jgi:hypothetical protein